MKASRLFSPGNGPNPTHPPQRGFAEGRASKYSTRKPPVDKRNQSGTSHEACPLPRKSLLRHRGHHQAEHDEQTREIRRDANAGLRGQVFRE